MFKSLIKQEMLLKRKDSKLVSVEIVLVRVLHVVGLIDSFYLFIYLFIY